MKIAIFENEYNSVRGAFESANLIKFNNNLELINFQSSQSADFSKIYEFSAIFVDIDLSIKSELDGFGLIQRIIKIDDKLTDRIIILTGNNKIEEILKERGIFSEKILIVIKPVSFKEIAQSINHVLKKMQQ